MSSLLLTTASLRTWLVRAAVLLSLGTSLELQASELCSAPDSNGISSCKAGLSASQVQAILVAQEKPQWCWAASIAMVFAHYGHEVSQEGIVRQQFGEAVDRAVSGGEMTSLLEGAWRDGKGRPFATNAVVAQSPDKRPGPAHQIMVSELGRQRPLVIGVAGHAMVLVRVEYDRLAHDGAIRITGGTVIDPVPGRGVRRLLAHEARPSYVAAVRVSDPGALALAWSPATRF